MIISTTRMIAMSRQPQFGPDLAAGSGLGAGAEGAPDGLSGKAHFGHWAALSDTSLPHSGHLMRATRVSAVMKSSLRSAALGLDGPQM